MKFKYVGDPSSPEKTNVLGVPFTKGEVTDVDENLVVNNKNVARIVAGMSHFVAVGKAAAEDGKPAQQVPDKPKGKAAA